MKKKSNTKQKVTRGKNHPPYIRLSEKRVAKSIIGSYGIISIIAKRCKVSRKAIYDFLKHEGNEEFSEMIKFENENSLDLSEEKLIDAIKRRQAWAIKFHLSTKGKARGYVQKFEVEDKSVNLDAIWEKLQNDRANPKRMEFLRRLASGEDPKTVLLQYEQIRDSGTSAN